VNWWVASGEWRRSPDVLGSCSFEYGSYFWEWMKSGNLIGSRRKKIGVSLPARSQLPSSV